MTKQCVHWKTYIAKSKRGSDYDCPFPELIAVGHKGTLISKILSMEKKQPLTFEQAARMTEEVYCATQDARRVGYLPGECGWYLINFTQWISSLGYHIELTGDEFDPYNPSIYDN